MPLQESAPQERIKDDKARQLDKLFREHEQALYRYVRYLSDSPSMAEDIYQETWLRVAQHIARGGRIRNFKNFIFMTAANLFRDELRMFIPIFLKRIMLARKIYGENHDRFQEQ